MLFLRISVDVVTPVKMLILAPSDNIIEDLEEE